MSDAVFLQELRALAEKIAPPDGADLLPLEAVDAALIQVGLAASVTSLNRTALRCALSEARARGATVAAVQEVISLVSGLGVHSLMVSATDIMASASEAGERPPLTADQSALWNKYVAGSRFWEKLEHEMPGFLESMLRLSADQFAAFFDYCSVPWKTQTLPAVLKELIAMATDATPAHRFLPGFRLHLANAVKLGANRVQILQTLELAAAAPLHEGVR